MAGEQKSAETIFDDPENPAGETGEGEGGVADKSVSGEGDGSEAPSSTEGEGETGETGEHDFEGLTFKTTKELVKGYKELQAHATRRDQEFQQMRQTLLQVLPLLPKKEQAEIKDDPEAFVKSFVENPRKVLTDIIQDVLGRSLKERVDPLEGSVNQVKAQSELNAFLRDHPEFTDEDADLLSKTIDAYPELRTRPDRLEKWFSLMKSENPEVAERFKQQKSTLEQDARSAKSAASLGGRKSSAPKATEGDEFDGVLALDAERRKFFNRG